MVLCTQECPPEVREHLEVRTILCARECRRILVHQAQNAREDSNRPESPKPPKSAKTSKKGREAPESIMKSTLQC